MQNTADRGVHMSKRTALAAGAAIVAIGAAGCGASSPGGGQASTAPAANTREVSPAGDIPDNQAYVAYAPPGGGFTVKVPEGWSRSGRAGAVVFTDKLNSIRVETKAAQVPLTARDARQTELPKLASSVSGFQHGKVTTVARKAGTAVRITYLAKANPDPVTGKTAVDAVERYVFFRNGKDVILTLSGPKGADNVDPWKIVTDSVTWSR
jgi:hypothetical protein